jgi:hypothetical protein
MFAGYRLLWNPIIVLLQTQNPPVHSKQLKKNNVGHRRRILPAASYTFAP